MSRRTERVASVVRTVIGTAIQTRLDDPRIEPITSVTRVIVSGDLSFARVYVSVLSDRPKRRDLTVAALRSASGLLRSLVADALHTRVVPELAFELDDSIQKGIETVDLLDELARETPEMRGTSEPAPETNDDDSTPDEDE